MTTMIYNLGPKTCSTLGNSENVKYDPMTLQNLETNFNIR